MTIALNRLYTGSHQYGAGTVQINIPFVGNTIAVELSTKPEYATTKQVIGTLFQFYGNAQKAYNLYSGKDIVRLELPETDKLWFSPTSYLSDNYTLTIDFTDVGTIINGSNTVSIPQQILELPTSINLIETELDDLRISDVDQLLRLATLEATATPALAWNNINNKPLAFNPATHSHEITDVLGLTNSLASKADVAHTQAIASITGLQTNLDNLSSSISDNSNSITSLGSTVSALQANSSSDVYIPISTNQALLSGKSYLANVSGLICTLPSDPSVGDVISLATGNYTFRVNHGNSQQLILNLSTQSTVGADNGIILKAYSSIQLLFIGSNQWVTSFRSRTINNYLEGGSPANQAYTPLQLEAYAYTTGYPLSKINDGVFSSGVMTNTGSGTYGEFGVIITTLAPISILSFNYWLGQYNAPVNVPTRLEVYTGSVVNASALIQSFTSLEGASSDVSIIGSKTITSPKSPSNTHLFLFKRIDGGGSISINELQIIGIAGGEVTAT